MAPRLNRFWPALLALAVSAGYVAVQLSDESWNPSALAQIGSRYAELDPNGTEGYDGQFAYYMALDLDPAKVAPHLDNPAYRYQRILYPVLARLVVAGHAAWIPWSLLVVNLAAQALGTYAVTLFLLDTGRWPGYALIYGLWVGLVAPVGLDLHEPLAFALVAAGGLAWLRGRAPLAALLLAAALFAKETTLPFWAALALATLLGRRERTTLLALGVGALAFGAWQLWLLATFGRLGLGSGGAMATPFEWIPFMGLWKVGAAGPAVLFVYLILFGPTVLLPVLWGLYTAGRSLLRGAGDAYLSWSLLLNAGLIVFLPFSTFREPFGLVRIVAGLVTALSLFSARHGIMRPLNYAMFWIAMLALLVPR